jgi:hypothetical protein
MFNSVIYKDSRLLQQVPGGQNEKRIMIVIIIRFEFPVFIYRRLFIVVLTWHVKIHVQI